MGKKDVSGRKRQRDNNGDKRIGKEKKLVSKKV